MNAEELLNDVNNEEIKKTAWNNTEEQVEEIEQPTKAKKKWFSLAMVLSLFIGVFIGACAVSISDYNSSNNISEEDLTISYLSGYHQSIYDSQILLAEHNAFRYIELDESGNPVLKEDGYPVVQQYNLSVNAEVKQ